MLELDREVDLFRQSLRVSYYLGYCRNLNLSPDASERHRVVMSWSYQRFSSIYHHPNIYGIGRN